MSECPDLNALSHEFRKERAVRRTLLVLEAKHKSIKSDLERLIKHLNFLVPSSTGNPSQGDLGNNIEVLEAALGRMEDDAFVQLMLRLLHESQ